MIGKTGLTRGMRMGKDMFFGTRKDNGDGVLLTVVK